MPVTSEKEIVDEAMNAILRSGKIGEEALEIGKAELLRIGDTGREFSRNKVMEKLKRKIADMPGPVKQKEVGTK